MIGLFCLLCLIAGCRKQTDPADVTVLFWTALAENNPEKAKKHATPGSEYFFDEKLKNAYIQTGKVEIHYDEATVETFISRQSAASSSSFKTYLIRIQKDDHWKVDYKKTLDNLKDKEFKDLFKSIRQMGKDALTHTKENFLPSVKEKSKSFLEKVKDWFKKLLG